VASEMDFQVISRASAGRFRSLDRTYRFPSVHLAYNIAKWNSWRLPLPDLIHALSP
jgi:hypothetical protein